MISAFVSIPGYQLSEEVYKSSRTIVYRGYREADYLPVVIKLLKNPYPSFNELVQFRNQYTIAKNLNFQGIIQTYSLETFQNGYILVMEDFGGVSLGDYYSHNQEFLQIAISLCDTLDVLYHQRIIHKDIKPRNILINPETKQVKLIDFSIASLLPRETQSLKNPNVLEGTLSYISPEQTGRMNRGIDYRTDFYSLGVTFYELLTGQLPFISDEPMELVHCHIAKIPPCITDIKPEIPKVLGKIVSKLMAKNAEDRYQSALGLKHDLETCLYQIKNTGKIEYFNIAQKDISDCFIIPDKLYGRGAEVQMVLEAFERVAGNSTSELMLVAGFSGIGKTAVVNEVHKPIVRQRGYFIKGKFDQFNRNIPFSAFVQAFRDLMQQLLSESDTQLQQWKTHILEAVGENGQVIIEVIPELEKIIGQQAPAIQLSGTAAQNRFNLLFQKFLQVFTTPKHPLVIFLDDLQWADSASLKLMQLLHSDSQTNYLFTIGAYRDSEVSPAHPLMLMLNEVANTGAIINTITLKALSTNSLNNLVADTLNCSEESARTLADLIYQKTQGNPFFATQFLKALHQDGLISFNNQRGWECDITQVQQAALTDDAVEFMSAQLQKLPQTTQEILKLAACIGNQFDLNTLAIVSEKSEIETATDLWTALQAGLVLPQTQIYKFYQRDLEEQLELGHTHKQLAEYKFLHDRVQQAAYSLIPDNHKQAVHLKIGQLLQQNLSEIEKEEKLFDIIGHLNLGRYLITQPEERSVLAQLNLSAGQKARNATAYNASKIYLQTGIDLLPVDCWQNQYKLTLNLYVAATESAYLNGEFDEMELIATQVLQSAQTILDKVKIYEIQISALTAQSKMLEAIAVGQNALTQLGVEFSCEPDKVLTDKVLQTLTEQLQGKQIEELINLPVMSDEKTIAAMQVLAILFSSILLARSDLLPLLGSIMVSLSLHFGNAPASIIGYIIYGMVLSTFWEEVERGYCFGRVALSLLNQLDTHEFKSQTLSLFSFFLQHRQEPLRTTILTMKEGYLAGIETGDLLYAGYNINNYFDDTFFAGISLEDWKLEIENYCVVLANAKQYSPLTYLKIKQQALHNLREIVNQPDLLIGTAYDEAVMLPKHHQDNEFSALTVAYIYKLKLAYFFDNYTNALDYISQANLYLTAAVGAIFIPIFHFYAALTYLGSLSTQSEIEQANTLTLVETHQTTLKQWAHHAPMNHQHKLDLIEAEKCRVLGKNHEAGDWYDRAIKGAVINEFLSEEALANELAAKFYLYLGKHQVACGYMQSAYCCYAKWGATAKINHLEQNYPQLLASILEPSSLSITNESTIAPTLIRSFTNISSSKNFSLDFPVVMKAAQAISQEIELEKLLATLMQTVITGAGAQIGHLILQQNKQWLVVARASSEQTQRLEIPLEQYRQIPQSLIYSVARTQETAVFACLSETLQFASDDYIIKNQPKSVLCTPISQQGQLIGILYLENNLTVDAFTSARLQVIQLLTAQAAISLKNAQLYSQLEEYSQTLEQKVSQRTQELTQKTTQLESTLQELQHTQAQLIQSEKMSSLGQLVAGIAHEINNPVNFIHGNIKHVKEYTQDLLNVINLCQQSNFNQKSVEQILDDIDLEFIEEDLPKTLKSMLVGTERIREIVLSLRTFSRIDESELKQVDIHGGINSTLLMLQHRLNQTTERSAIEVIKNYGQLPLIECYAGQLNQVFLNILTNAIDAIEEKNIQQNEQQIELNAPQIIIRTTVIDSNLIEIAVKDTGIGMNDKVTRQMFNPFFTTKSVGKGTGMGMSISYQIITKKHGGKLNCISIPNQETELIIQIPICQ